MAAPDALAALAAAKAEGGALFARGEYAAAQARYDDALDAATATRDAGGEVTLGVEADVAACHANVAACALKLGRHAAAEAASAKGLATPRRLRR
jgi:hypothetical protein